MELVPVLLTILALPAALVIWTAYSLSQQVAKAKTIGLPYLVRWISPINPFWLLYGSSIVRLCERLGIATENLSRIYSYGWEANERANLHLDYGSAVLVVHPAGITLCLSDASAIRDILKRRTDFRRNMEEFAVLNVYGKNLSTTDDQEWQRHRKMTAVTFTEKNNELVWQRSLEQAKGMLDYWTQQKEPITSTHEDTKIFTLNVLAAALFNRVYPFEGHGHANALRDLDDKSLEYRESLSIILKSIIQIFVFGEKGLRSWWTPKSWKQAADAMVTFRSYILGLMNEERESVKAGKPKNQHLVARLVDACEESPMHSADTNSDAEGGPRKMTLTEEEIVSNLFLYAFAGNDTTSITLFNIIIHLAAHPETQNWISEELKYFIPSSMNPTNWPYHLYPSLDRVSAVIMESLRICHPLSQLVKTTGNTSQALVLNGNHYTIPPHTTIHCSLPALHTHPRYWGSNPLSWNPKRFITSQDPYPSRRIRIESEVLADDTTEYFMPWAWGQRACPGKKFSQVELVAALAVLFRDWRVEVVPREGESVEGARERAWRASLVVDHEGHMLHEMVRPEGVALKWIRV